MKKKSIITLAIIAVVIVLIIVFSRPSPAPAGPEVGLISTDSGGSPTPVVVVSDTGQVSSKLSKYENAELGFSVDYPTAWEADQSPTGVTFIMPIDQTQVSTVAKLQADVTVAGGKCAFPPVTTINDRGTMTSGSNTFSMISMSNSVQGRQYFNRMYTLQHGDVCYVFTLSTIALSPESKGLTGSNVTQAQNNNKAIIDTSDSDFTTMVKSFTFIQGPAGIDETKA
ncbi:MAG: hypothetical protein KGI45_02970, partial [Patescibacteria group bacterium]|nr:hypothetical protein [Patescibacteria group bacterium]